MNIPVVRILFGDHNSGTLLEGIHKGVNFDKSGAWDSVAPVSVHWMVFGSELSKILIHLGVNSKIVHLLSDKSFNHPEGESGWWNKTKLIRLAYDVLQTRDILFLDMDARLRRSIPSRLEKILHRDCNEGSTDLLLPVIRIQYPKRAMLARQPECEDKHICTTTNMFYCRDKHLWDDVLSTYPVVRAIRGNMEAFDTRHAWDCKRIDDEEVLTYYLDKRYGVLSKK